MLDVIELRVGEKVLHGFVNLGQVVYVPNQYRVQDPNPSLDSNPVTISCRASIVQPILIHPRVCFPMRFDFQLTVS